MAEKSGRKDHLDRLDVLRAVAFLLVYTSHLAVCFKSGTLAYHGLTLDWAALPLHELVFAPLKFGWIGVALFFVLSGFCIHYAQLHRTEPFSIRDFYGRRFLRIYPAYLAAVIVYSALHADLPFLHFNAGNVIMHVFMVHNLLKATIFGIDGVLWSLGVEMQFYLLYPLLLRLMHRWGGVDRVLVLGLALNIGMQLYLGYVKKNSGWNPVSVTWSFPLVTWCDWILGVCLAEAYVRGRRVFSLPKTWLVFSGVMLAAAFENKILNAESYLFGAVFFAVAMQLYLGWRTPLRGLERALIPIGIISYSLYLWHQPLVYFADRWSRAWALTRAPHGHFVFVLVVATVLTTAIASVSYVFLEVQAPRMIRRFMTKRHLQPPSLPGPAASPLFP